MKRVLHRDDARSSPVRWGGFALIIGVLQLFAAFSLASGGGFGRWIGILAAGLSCSLTEDPGAPVVAAVAAVVATIIAPVVSVLDDGGGPDDGGGAGDRPTDHAAPTPSCSA
jgi:hypothetical protein